MNDSRTSVLTDPAWRGVSAAVLFQAWTIGTIQYSFTFWIEPWMNEFGVGRAELITAVLVAQIGTTLLSPIAGRVMDAWSLRWLAAGGLIAFAAGMLLTAFATSPWLIIAAYGPLMALAMPFAGPLMGQTIVAKWFREKRGLAMGWVTTGTSIGGFLLPPLAASLIAFAGWRTTNMVFAAVALFVLVPLVFLLVKDPPRETAAGDRSGGGVAESISTWGILKDRAFWIPCLGFIPAFGMISAVQINFGPYSADLGYSGAQASFFVSLIAGTMIGGKLFFGAMVDRIDARLLFFLVCCLLVAALLLMALQPGYVLLLVISVLIGFGGGGLLPLSAVVLASQFGEHLFGRVMGLFYFAFTAGTATAPVAGFIRDASGSYAGFFYLMAAVMVVAALPMVSLQRGRTVAA